MKRAPAIVVALLALPALAVLAGAAVHYFETRATGTLVSRGVQHSYIVHVPRGYDPGKPTPLVISMHGGMNWPAFQMKVSGWNRLADEEGFLVVYPAGEGQAFSTWGPRQVRFISELIDKLRASYNIDPARIYANGFSNGGGMSFVLSCTLSHRIAAVGLVGSAQTFPWGWCRDPKPVPMISLHGKAETLALYHGGYHWIVRDSLPGVPQWTASWARRNRCGPDATDSPAGPGVTKREYTGCANEASVVLYTIENGGHTWPGGLRLPEWLLGETSYDIDATRVMWKFFQEHPLR